MGDPTHVPQGQVTRDHYIAKPPVSADLSELLERLAESDELGSVGR